jgi:hypothetical protein
MPIADVKKESLASFLHFLLKFLLMSDNMSLLQEKNAFKSYSLDFHSSHRLIVLHSCSFFL